MSDEKALETIKKIFHEKSKITIDTELDVWYGEMLDGTKTAITEISLLEAIAHGFGDKNLKEEIETKNLIILPDGTRLGKTIRAIRDDGMIELAAELSNFATQQNIRSGFSDPNPE